VRKSTAMLLVMAIAVWLIALPAAAHPHETEASGQVLANGQNHPGFQDPNQDGLRLSCEGTLEPEDSGPAGYGLETAHHGPDAGTPGKADGCYAVVGDPVDNNPAID
jgi:hypothetical protein